MMKKYLLLILLLFSNSNEIFGQQQNFLTASGNKLYDTTGKEVRLTGVNWFGFETSLYSPHGIWSRDMKSVLQQIKDLGFNTIRVPWCNEMLNPGSEVNINSYGTDSYSGVSPMNEEEAKVSTPIELMDIFVNWCQKNDMKIVLDNHSRAADGFLNEAYWYTNQYSEERWISDWLFIADRYKNYSAVVALDLNNEPHGSTWGNSNPATDWNKAAERCGNAILEVNPNVLIMVEGVGEFEGDSYWWGGQLKGAKKYPVQLSNPNKLFYSAHEYGPEVAQQDWFEAPNFPDNMPAIWEENFHYLYQNNTSPLFIGEFGIKNQDAFGGISYTWITEFMGFMGDIYSWTFWTMNPNSGDTGGILKDDWTNVNQWKIDVLSPHFAPLIPNVVGGVNNNLPPIAIISTSTTSGNAPLVVEFSGSNSSDPNDDSLTYSWNFGDGTTGNGETVSHTFDTEGSYQVVLTVNDGTTNDSATVTITAGNDDPGIVVTASIVSDINGGVAPVTINFDGTDSSSSDGSALTYRWDFGDNTNGNGATISHTYTNANGYIVTLTVTNPDGISDTVSRNIIITDDTGNPTNCDFDTPLNTALATIPNVSYSNAYVLGTGGPNLNNVTNVTINWDLQNNGLWQFSMNTNNGSPSWWNNLKTSITSQNFNSAQPSVTLSGTGFPNLDGTYYAAIDDGNFALVSVNDSFTLYFSNDSDGPACEDTILRTLSSKEQLIVKVFPVPTEDNIMIQLTDDLKEATIHLVDISGKLLRTISSDGDIETITVDMSNLNSGVYFIMFNSIKGTYSKQIIKN